MDLLSTTWLAEFLAIPSSIPQNHVMHEMTLIELIVLTHISSYHTYYDLPFIIAVNQTSKYNSKTNTLLFIRSKVSKQWFEWISSWVSSNMVAKSAVCFTAGSVSVRSQIIPPPIIEYVIHTDLGKTTCLYNGRLPRQFFYLYPFWFTLPMDVPDYIPFQIIPKPSSIPPITVWKAIKHFKLYDISHLIKAFDSTPSSSSYSSQLIQATHAFIVSLDTFDLSFPLRGGECVEIFENTLLLQVFVERATTGKQPVRFQNIVDLDTVTRLLSIPEISPFFQPHSIVLSFEPNMPKTKWEDLQFIMSKSTVTKIIIEYQTKEDAIAFSNLIHNVLSQNNNNDNNNNNNNRGSPFASVTKITFIFFKTSEKISSWLTPSIFPSLQSIVIKKDGCSLKDLVRQINRFPNPLLSFEIGNGQGCLRDIHVKSLTLGSGQFDLSKNTFVDRLVINNIDQSKHTLISPNLKELVMPNCSFNLLNQLLKPNPMYDNQDLAITITPQIDTDLFNLLIELKTPKKNNFDWIQHRQGIRELNFLGDGLDEKATTMILDQLYRRHLNNIKPIELITGINIVDSQIAPNLSTIYRASRHTLQSIYVQNTIQKQILFYLLDSKERSINLKSKLRLNLVSKLWFEWVGEWVSSNVTATSVGSRVVEGMNSLPSPLIEYVIHTCLGKTYLKDCKLSSGQFLSLYPYRTNRRGPLGTDCRPFGYIPPTPPPRSIPPMTVWKTVKHFTFLDLFDLNRVYCSNLFLEIEATRSFIESLETVDVYSTLQDTVDAFNRSLFMPALVERVAKGKQPVRLHNIMDIGSTASYLSKPEISPLFQPHSIIISFEPNMPDTKWEDLRFIMSRLTVSKIKVDFTTTTGISSRYETLFQNVIESYNNNNKNNNNSNNRGTTLKNSPFSSVTSIEFVELKTSEKISSWLTPSIFPSLQSLVVKDGYNLADLVRIVNQFPNPLVSFQSGDKGYQYSLEDIHAKSLTIGDYYSFDFSKSTYIDTLVINYTRQPKSTLLLPPNLRVLHISNCYCDQLNKLMNANHNQDLIVRIAPRTDEKSRVPKRADFDWIQQKQGIREVTFLGGDGLDEKSTIMILRQLYLRHLNNIKPIELVTGLNIVDSQITPILSNIYHASRHTLQLKY
ncbi:hypothetical protein DFA_04448 [Cavenderia fasciculata]|uniref:Uncharacterized protein n=1 Tax=Cavenderia fasciculata TaxID=261658 RepID=F4PPL7_CACFS|nr:uncharacterized protein DFA_04448 [Cavenderia fasciculata]EGG22330.1 hypothetical protein DFA_04448 [Cavenderia fasciculata]|eukprot:XP_004360181.1 hypothetical protein DFA_04448 [Cavenderia fasciculata]